MTCSILLDLFILSFVVQHSEFILRFSLMSRALGVVDKVPFAFKRITLPGEPRTRIPSDEEMSRTLEENIDKPDILVVCWTSVQPHYFTDTGMYALHLVQKSQHAMTCRLLEFDCDSYCESISSHIPGLGFMVQTSDLCPLQDFVSELLGTAPR